MNDLTTSISVALDRREALALAATPGPWRAMRGNEYMPWRLDGIERFRGHVFLGDDEATAKFIADNDPARVLRDIAAKRKVLERHRPHAETPAHCATCFEPGQDYDDYGCHRSWPCAEILDLAEAEGVSLTEEAERAGDRNCGAHGTMEGT